MFEVENKVPPHLRRHTSVDEDVGRLIQIRDAHDEQVHPVWHITNSLVGLLRGWSEEEDYQHRLRQVAGLKYLRQKLFDEHGIAV